MGKVWAERPFYAARRHFKKFKLPPRIEAQTFSFKKENTVFKTECESDFQNKMSKNGIENKVKTFRLEIKVSKTARKCDLKTKAITVLSTSMRPSTLSFFQMRLFV